MVCFQLRLREALLAVALAAGAAVCVDAYGGSDLQIDFSSAVVVPTGDVGDPIGPNGTVGEAAHVPADTYFTFYGIDDVTDDTGVVVRTDAFEFSSFEVRPVIDTGSPCFVELEDAQFPGLHATQVANKLKEVICDRLGLDSTCMDDPFNPPSGATDNDVTDVLDANSRMSKQPSYQSVVKAITSPSAFEYPSPTADCNFTGDQIPNASCTDDASNAQRLRVCKDLWASHPDYYEGSDKVFTLPLAGTWYGMVEGANPINGGPIGGSSQFVDSSGSGFDHFTMNWQFRDHDGDGEPDYPASWLTGHDPSNIGYVYMAGDPESKTRGVINSRLSSAFDANVTADVAIFANLGEDDTSF